VFCELRLVLTTYNSIVIMDINDFNLWLSAELQTLKADESVFVPYIVGILEGDEDMDEKLESVEEILSELLKVI